MKSSEPKTNCDVPALWWEHKSALKNYIFKRVKNHELTEDILQEVLLKIYNFCLSRSGVRNVRSWLFQIAHNTIIDHFRKEKKYSDREAPEVPEEDQNFAFQDAVEYIQPLLNFLPKEYALPLKLADIDGLKQTEVAEKLNLSLPAVKSRIQRGRKLLKQEFLTCCYLETDAGGNLISFEIKDSCVPLQQLKKKN